MAKKSKATRLPNAPLAEVVFELRWNLQPAPEGQLAVNADPGTIPLLNTFTPRMKRAKFGFFRDMSHPGATGPYGVVRRFFPDAKTPFPILQIGVGIFASNASSEYDFSGFRKQTLMGISNLLASYPKMDFFSLSPNHLELRYVDVFDHMIVDGSGFFEFLNRETAFKFTLPPMLRKGTTSGRPIGRFGYESGLKEWKDSRLIIDIASAIHNETKKPAIRMQTTVRTTGEGVPKLVGKASFANGVGKWLDYAHAITSPLFKETVSANIMNKFKEL